MFCLYLKYLAADMFSDTRLQKRHENLKQVLTQQVQWLQLNSLGTELSMTSQSNKDLTGLLAQGRTSYPKRRKTSFAGLIKRERHRGIAKEGHGRLILLGEDEPAFKSSGFAILESVEL